MQIDACTALHSCPGSTAMNKKIILIVLAVIVVITVSGIIGAEYYTSRPSFCGSCHIMKLYYDSWKKDKHSNENVTCVDCHYPPGEQRALKSKFKGLGQLFTYLGSADETVRKRARIDDQSCTTAKCHPREQYVEKEFKFLKAYPFVHKTHEEKLIEGQKLHCNTCHQHIRENRHFEVPRMACALCHFKNTEFNEGRGKCSLCHEIPQGPLQKQKKGNDPDEKPVTHQSLEQAKVPCRSCHYELIQSRGDIKEEDCFDCHAYSNEMLTKSRNKKLMHKEHVAAQNADCFDCHEPIQHKKMNFLDPVRVSCYICHPDHHKYQTLMIMGDKRKDVSTVPGLMYDVKTNCIGCHTEEKTINGEKVLAGSPQSCVACHTEKHDKMVKEWKDKTGEELQAAKEIENEAEAALKKAKGNVPPEVFKEAESMFALGQENIRIVEYGGGVHNKKYSVILLDEAMNNFEDLIDALSE
jgi:nitrate/TMAO reductase-like tetraheme cytochrome c subunit